jgi:hypothetical protein
MVSTFFLYWYIFDDVDLATRRMLFQDRMLKLKEAVTALDCVESSASTSSFVIVTDLSCHMQAKLDIAISLHLRLWEPS